MKTEEIEVLGNIRESVTSYATITNENGKTFFQTTVWDYETETSHDVVVTITQENLDALSAGTWTDSNGREISFDGCRTMGGIPWSHGPCDKFKRYLKSTGQITISPNRA